MSLKTTHTAPFYSKTILKSYYLGCSGGGRQGLKAAEKYPRDFDGIVIGAPALNFNYLSSWLYQAMQPGSEILAADRLYAGLPFPYSLEWFRYVVHQDPAWDPQNFSDVDIILAQDLNPFNIMTYPRDLDSFRQKKSPGWHIVTLDPALG
ncbi:putative feruloyl esterase B-2 [Glarea lozoyensis 74030]|uniref:Carboxylic ester hydrolase n=1 Tax=Glarea lozoyensis (strain ATCC 74030 / MF5533) TaxID=1104152 RepID=H0ED95_GLAL7|nr:putative feruloyl esterase B-2 [Glarea lozoyensis 74030]